ncbi:MAG: hypothetical protein JWR37_4482 [Mycobacterium sp.]|nr:hypothetical protein [Mycobacterium sp.]
MLDAVALMRTQGLSLSAAAREAGTRPATVRRYAAPALVQQGRRHQVTPSDRLYRRMRVLTPDGRRDVDVRSSRQASRVAAHYNAIQHYLRTGDDTALRKFRNVCVGGQPLATDLQAIERHASAGELAIDDIYPHR